MADTPINVWDRDLSPSLDLLSDWKHRKITWTEYETRFRKEIPEDFAMKRLAMHQNNAQGVTIYCGGYNKVISNFFEDIRAKGNERGIVFKIVDKIELPPDCRLPVEFLKLDTDVDNSRKLDKGIEILKDIKGDISVLPGIKGDTSILPEIKAGIDNMNIKFDSFIHGQERHNLRLEKILEKPAERCDVFRLHSKRGARA